MVARTNVGRPISVRRSHFSGAKFGRGTFYLYAVLGHSSAETNLAVIETSRSRDWDVSGASLAHCLLRNTRASLWYIRPLVLRPFANQAASHTLAGTSCRKPGSAVGQEAVNGVRTRSFILLP